MVTDSPDDSSRHEEPPKAPDTLDEKLRSVIMGLPDSEGGISDGDMDDGIAQIKAVFQEAGWIDTKKPITGDIHGVGVYEVDMHMMTSAEWYHRLEAKINEAGITFQPGDTGSQVIVAAQRASGITEDSK